MKSIYILLLCSFLFTGCFQQKEDNQANPDSQQEENAAEGAGDSITDDSSTDDSSTGDSSTGDNTLPTDQQPPASAYSLSRTSIAPIINPITDQTVYPRTTGQPVSYTHLTLPTIYSV